MYYITIKNIFILIDKYYILVKPCAFKAFLMQKV